MRLKQDIAESKDRQGLIRAQTAGAAADAQIKGLGAFKSKSLLDAIDSALSPFGGAEGLIRKLGLGVHSAYEKYKEVKDYIPGPAGMKVVPRRN